ncbi:Bromodomain-containing protein [Trichodelitschia bisporula]|uniref:Bromodomain-containing protein n=1 Tax=Trichodelitschia bisporula TaxID=703511 RepID=A0A6G1HVN2_9PEZI|nr:Bromodomain-containing protein [Trichodelitschia bisporula]
MADPAESTSPVPTTETPARDDASKKSVVTDEEWRAMQDILNAIYAYRTEEGDDPSKLFHRKVNRRLLPDYYTVIKEPMAMSTVKAKIANREYKKFSEFVRDFALISHNAQVYNLPESQAYLDALTIKDLLEKELKKLVESKLITEEVAKLPFLGEIPPQDDAPEEAEEEEEEEEDDEDDEEPDDSDDEGARKKRKRASRVGVAKGEAVKTESKKAPEDPDTRKKRGRPPRVDTPMEARIKAVMKGLRKYKTDDGQLLITDFERLPEKAAMPEYFAEIKNPIALDVIKKKLKRKKYTSLDQFMKDLELMFDNAKAYNTDESQIYKDAVFLQKEARAMADAEKKKPDTEYVMEDGRLPMPDGIHYNGELWKVGDWVHLQNANDLTKPIVAQIYRTWQDQQGHKWINACWYYRPEQTVHRFDRHFYENEVVKTGQYRDHPVDEIVDRCFVMFFTRFNKGRPRNFPTDKEIYVCESRYNEEKHKLNKIKTWASCLPDEVRDKDYEMDLFEVPKKMKKVPSPIKFLFKEGEQKETDDLPKPVWGAPNAPPRVGAVHCRPRDEKESPPPEPTPTPPPPPPVPAPRPISSAPPIAVQPVHQQLQAASPAPIHPAPTPGFTPAHASHYHGHSASPAPLQPMPPTPFTPHQQPFAPQPIAPTPMAHIQPTPAPGYGPTSTPMTGIPMRQAHKAPTPVEVYHLPDQANASIPPEIRQQFQTDDQGRVLFFTAPPRPPPQMVTIRGTRLAHTPKYLAWRAEKEIEARKAGEKRKAEEEEQRVQPPPAKKARFEEEPQPEQPQPEPQTKEELEQLARKHFAKLYVEGIENLYKAEYGLGDDDKQYLRAMLADVDNLIERQKKWKAKEEAYEATNKKYEENAAKRIAATKKARAAAAEE